MEQTAIYVQVEIHVMELIRLLVLLDNTQQLELLLAFLVQLDITALILRLSLFVQQELVVLQVLLQLEHVPLDTIAMESVRLYVLKDHILLLMLESALFALLDRCVLLESYLLVEQEHTHIQVRILVLQILLEIILLQQMYLQSHVCKGISCLVELVQSARSTIIVLQDQHLLQLVLQGHTHQQLGMKHVSLVLLDHLVLEEQPQLYVL